MLAEREHLNRDIWKILAALDNPGGTKVAYVEITHVDLNDGMTRAIVLTDSTQSLSAGR